MAAIAERDSIDEINKLHRELEQLGLDALGRAVQIGKLLSQQKGKLPHGGWIPWLRDNVVFSERAARNYVAVFENRTLLKSANVADLSEAYRLLSQRSQPINSSSAAEDSVQMSREEAERLHAEVVDLLRSCRAHATCLRAYRDSGVWRSEYSSFAELLGHSDEDFSFIFEMFPEDEPENVCPLCCKDDTKHE
jgi:hypothetical protein